MDRKFVKTKKVITSVLTVIMILLQAFPTFAITPEETWELMNTISSVEIEIDNIPRQNIIAVNNGVKAQETKNDAQPPKPRPYITELNHKNWLGLYETYELSNFPVLRERLEKLFPTTVNADGTKTGMLYPKGRNSNYWNAIAYDELYNMLQKPEVQAELKEAAKYSFSDIKGNEWYLDKLALATYYGVITGKPGPNGTFIFDGSAPVTRAEFPTMLYRVMWQTGSIYNTNFSEEDMYSEWTKKTFGGFYWYVPYVNAYRDKFMVPLGDGLTKEIINKPMTRLECVALIVNLLYSGEEPKGEASTYFKDVKKRFNAMVELGLARNEGEWGYRAENASLKLLEELLKNPGKGIDEASYRALALAYEKGIMKGDGKGNSNWNQPVTRAEAIQMLYNLVVYETQVRAK